MGVCKTHLISDPCAYAADDLALVNERGLDRRRRLRKRLLEVLDRRGVRDRVGGEEAGRRTFLRVGAAEEDAAHASWVGVCECEGAVTVRENQLQLRVRRRPRVR